MQYPEQKGRWPRWWVSTSHLPGPVGNDSEFEPLLLLLTNKSLGDTPF